MHISIAFFFVEMIRSACGGLWVAAHDQAALLLQTRSAVPISEELALEIETRQSDDLLRGVPGVKIYSGVVFAQDPVGLDPAGPDASTSVAGSILATQGEALPGFLEELVKAGAVVKNGGIHEFDAGASAVGGGSSTGAVSLHYRLRQYTIVPPTSFAEAFTLMVPSPLPTTPQPLLVVFHKFGSSNLDVLQNTDYVRQCAQRGWFLVCPLSASKKHFSSIESQQNTEAVLDWTLANSVMNIDRQRIYAIGFSMGGGAVMNYAARHRDPAHAVFAAVINHSGNVSLRDTYFHDGPVRFIFDFWFGDGTVGSASHWKMNRSSVINFDPITLAIDPSSDLSRNLGSTPISSFQAAVDLVPYLPGQNDILDQHMRLDLGRQVGPQYSYTVVPFSGHDWRMVDASAACDWFAQFTLQIPLVGRTLADRDGVYEHFYVEQDAGGAFTPFDWSCVPATNELHVTATANLKRLTNDPIATGLSTSSELHVFTQSADGTGDEIVLAHWPLSPSAVTRDGFSTANWTFDSLTHDLTLVETDGAAHAWIVRP